MGAEVILQAGTSQATANPSPHPPPLSLCTVWAQIFAYVSITRPVIYFIFGLPYEFAQRVDGAKELKREGRESEREEEERAQRGNSFTWTLPGAAAAAVIDI